MIRLEQAFGWAPGTAAGLTADQLSLYLEHSIPSDFGMMAGVDPGPTQKRDDNARFDAAAKKNKTLEGVLKELARGDQ